MRRPASSFLAAALLLGTATLTSVPARSQTAPAGADASQSADEFFRSGKALYKAGKLPEAYEAYRSAWRLKHTYDIAANLANTESQLGKTRDAVEHLAFCIKNFPPTSGKAQLDRIKAQFDEARREVGALTLTVNVEGAEVFVDGASVGRAPLSDEVYVDPGARTVEARLSGYATAKQSVEVAKGPAQPATLTLVPAGPPPLPTGTGPTPVPPPPRSRVPLFVLGGASAVGLGVGIATTVVANAKRSDVDTQRTAILSQGGQCAKPAAGVTSACGQLQSTLKAVDTNANAARVAYVASGLLAIGAVTYALLPQPRSTKSGVLVVPVVARDSGGLNVVGVW